jgi:hypothetical protein
MSVTGEMYHVASEELRRFLDEGNERWRGYVSPIHLLLGVAKDIAKEDVELGYRDYWAETLWEYLEEYHELRDWRKQHSKAAPVPDDEECPF